MTSARRPCVPGYQLGQRRRELHRTGARHSRESTAPAACSSAWHNAVKPSTPSGNDNPSALAIAGGTCCGSRSGPSETQATAAPGLSASLARISCARRVFPTPAIPTTVTRRERCSASWISRTPASRPTRGPEPVGPGTPGDGRAAARWRNGRRNQGERDRSACTERRITGSDTGSAGMTAALTVTTPAIPGDSRNRERCVWRPRPSTLRKPGDLRRQGCSHRQSTRGQTRSNNVALVTSRPGFSTSTSNRSNARAPSSTGLPAGGQHPLRRDRARNHRRVSTPRCSLGA